MWWLCKIVVCVRVTRQVKILWRLFRCRLLQSYTGSRDMWGLHDPAASKYSMPIYDDGKIEVIGLQSAGVCHMQQTRHCN